MNSTALSVADEFKKYGRYTIKGLLGEGSMGYVYRAHDPRIDRQVALKVLRKNHITSEKYVQRFNKEAQAIGRLSHPSIVTVHDVGQDHGTVYIAMELIEGTPLDQLLKTRKFDLIEVIDLGVQVANALDYAHQKGVVHRDIKPSNLIMVDGGHIILTDFGIAHMEDTSTTQQTKTGDILGTPAFMSPEQIEGRTIDNRSDLFSLGIILYRLICNEWPFSGKSMAALFNVISNVQPKKPIKINPATPPALSALIMKSLEKVPGRRFQTGKEMASALRACSSNLVNTTKARSKMPALYLLMLVVTLAGAGGWLVPKHLAHRRPTVQSERPIHQPKEIANVPAVLENPQKDKNASANDTYPVKAQVSIRSDPANAEIYIDNHLKGRTPTNLNLPMGIYELRLNLPDYYETKVVIDVSGPGPMPLKFRLMPNRST